MASKNQVTLTLAGDASDLKKAFDQASAASKEMGDAAMQSGRESEKGFDTATFSAVGLADSIGNMADVVDSVKGAFRAGATNAARLARAQNDLEQSALDASQAQLDLRQSTRDAAQSEIDAEQAALDLRQAQEDHTAAVKEFGRNSIEAKQALIDQKQAQEDLKQAQEDGKQATQDGKQAAVDATAAQLDMAEAQREVTDASGWSGWLDTVAQTGPALLGVVSTVSAVRSTVVASTAANAAHKVSLVASAAATKGMAIAQRILNAAMRANPIGIVITILAALGAAIVLAWKKSETFRNIVKGAMNGIRVAFGWVLDRGRDVAGWFSRLPGTIGRALSGIGSAIAAPFKAGFDAVRNFWNSTIGGRGFSIDLPFGLPDFNLRIPTLHQGGIVPGSPGSETLALLQAGERVSPAAQQPKTVALQSDGSALSDLIVDTLRGVVRAEGGNVQFVLGQA